MSSSEPSELSEEQKAVKLLKEKGYFVLPPDYLETRQQCFYCGQWQSVKLMKPLNFSGLVELLCASCYNKMIAREDALSIEVERSEGYANRSAFESPSISEAEESGDNS